MNDQDKINIRNTMKKLNKCLDEIRVNLGNETTYDHETAFSAEIQRLEELLTAYKATLEFFRVSNKLY